MRSSAEWLSIWESKRGATVASLSGRSSYSDAQRQLLADEAARHLNLKPTDTLLDVGCAAGFTGELLIPRVSRYVGVDYSAAALDSYRARVQGVLLYQESATKMRFVNRAFSKALVGSVLLCLDMDECARALRELRRVTRDRALISGNLERKSGAVTDWGPCADGCYCHKHATWFTREELVSLALRAGWGWAEAHDIHPDLTPHSRIMFDLVVGA
jgi:SAM-dependent methyltransferase